MLPVGATGKRERERERERQRDSQSQLLTDDCFSEIPYAILDCPQRLLSDPLLII
jgi:hypothetical protein